MNRHIYGLTLFLAIVKIHFLRYWALFAPINFFSTQTTVSPNVGVLMANEPRATNCKRYRTHTAVLQNAAIDIRNMKVSANVRFNDLETAFEASEFVPRLSIFNEETSQTVILEPVYGAEGSTVVTYKGDLPKNGNWNPKSNYYTQVEFEYDGSPKNWKVISSIEQAVPVLIIRDKHR